MKVLKIMCVVGLLLGLTGCINMYPRYYSPVPVGYYYGPQGYYYPSGYCSTHKCLYAASPSYCQTHKCYYYN